MSACVRVGGHQLLRFVMNGCAFVLSTKEASITTPDKAGTPQRDVRSPVDLRHSNRN